MKLFKAAFALLTLTTVGLLAMASEGVEKTFYPVSMVIEEGTSFPGGPVFDVESDARAIYVFEIIGGGATFADGSQATYTEGHSTIVFPAILPSPNLYEQSILRVKREGDLRPLWNDMTITSVPEGNVNQFMSMNPQAGLIDVDKNYVIVDLAVFVANDRLATGEGASEDLCVRVAWGPGKVKWDFSNPSGAGYSVKPESSSNITAACCSSQDVDGVYRSSWGCCNALKIPDSCTVTFYSNGSYSYCCNAAMMQLGHVVQWINPCSLNDWPNCPL